MDPLERIASTAWILGRRCGLALAIYPLLAAVPEPRASGAGVAADGACARPAAGDWISQPAELSSRNGELHVSLAITSAPGADDHTRYCYLDSQGHQAPTLRLQAGDMLYLRLANQISAPVPTPVSPRRDACAGDTMSAASTNLHFHGLALPPVCHQDDTLRTLVQPGTTFEYRVRIPPEQPPGLYWYHPHVHGFSETHLLGGASGAIIVEGIDRVVPALRGLPERILVVRDEWMPDDSPPAAAGNLPRPTKQLSINYVPVRYPAYEPARLELRAGARELWRVLNASADTYLYLYVEFSDKRQLLGLVGLDGVPLALGQAVGPERVRGTTLVFMPPGTRAEFIVTAPDSAASGRLMTGYVNRGDDDAAAPRPGAATAQPADQDPTRPLAAITVYAADRTRPAPRTGNKAVAPAVVAPLGSARVARTRVLYFSEAAAAAGMTEFFITEEGKTPAVFDPARAHADITVRQGQVEDWRIENRSREIHTFHVHQLHFLVVARSLQAVTEPDLLDTVNVPAWRGIGAYPSVTLRMDFRNRRIVGLFPFHCHIAQHLDGGMMGTVRVLPPASRDPQTSPAELH